MNKNMICCKCKQRPAVIFVTKMEGEKTTNEGYCIKCAMEMNIGPIKQMMESMGDDFELGGASTFPFMQNMGMMPMDVPEENIKDLNGDKKADRKGKKMQGTKNDKR